MSSDMFIFLSSVFMIGGISWFFFGKRKKEEDTQSQPEGKIEIAEFSITGMHCAGCAAGIEATIKSMNGVKTASVNFGTSKGIFTFDSSKIRKEDIVAKIRDLGYDVSFDIEDFEKKS